LHRRLLATHSHSRNNGKIQASSSPKIQTERQGSSSSKEGQRHSSHSLHNTRPRRNATLLPLWSSQVTKTHQPTETEPSCKKPTRRLLTKPSPPLRIIRACEVGYPPTSPKYELAIKLSTPIDGPTIKNRLSLPHPVRTDLRIAVICDPSSPAAAAAKQAGAALVGTEDLFAQIKAGSIDFDRCLAHEDALPALQKSGVARVLGPRGLMPNVKTRTVVKDVATAVKEVLSGVQYAEKMGVVRASVGQLGFTTEMLDKNVRALVGLVKKDLGALSETVRKEIHEIVLSSTHGPGLSLSGEVASKDGISVHELREHVWLGAAGWREKVTAFWNMEPNIMTSYL
jgi:large subunit ribosomal protein L1